MHSLQDLRFAGACNAHSVVIFSQPVKSHGDRQMADTQTVLTALRVRQLAPATFTIVDLHEGANARFFNLAPKAALFGRAEAWESVLNTKTVSSRLRTNLKRGGAGDGPLLHLPRRRGSIMPARRKLRAEQAGAEVEGSPAAKAGHHGADGAAAEAVAGATASSRRSSLPTIALGLISRPACASSPGRGARPSSEDPRRNSRDVVEKQTAGGADGAKVKVEGMEAGGLARGLEANLKTADLHLSKAFAGGRVYCASLVDKLLRERWLEKAGYGRRGGGEGV